MPPLPFRGPRYVRVQPQNILLGMSKSPVVESNLRVGLQVVQEVLGSYFCFTQMFRQHGRKDRQGPRHISARMHHQLQEGTVDLLQQTVLLRSARPAPVRASSSE